MSLHRFEHFDVNSMVVKSVDHGETLSIGSFVCLFVTITFTVYDGQFAPPSFHFQELLLSTNQRASSRSVMIEY